MWFKKLLAWARITNTGDDSQRYATQQVGYQGKTANAFMVFPYGTHANATVDSLALLLTPECNPENRAAIAWTPTIRPQLEAGEVAFYHPETLSTVIWRQGGDLEITTTANVSVTCNNLTANATGSTTITTPTLTLNGNLVVNGTMTNNGFDVGNTHSHAQGPDSNGDSEANIVGVL